jgi:hypothetical protein
MEISNAADNMPNVAVSSWKCSFKSLIIRIRWMGWTKLAQIMIK